MITHAKDSHGFCICQIRQGVPSSAENFDIAARRLLLLVSLHCLSYLSFLCHEFTPCVVMTSPRAHGACIPSYTSAATYVLLYMSNSYP